MVTPHLTKKMDECPGMTPNFHLSNLIWFLLREDTELCAAPQVVCPPLPPSFLLLSLPDAGTPQLRGGLAYSCSSVFTGWGKRQVQVQVYLETNLHFFLQWVDIPALDSPPRSLSGFLSVSLFTLGGPGHPRSSRLAIFRSARDAGIRSL